MTNTEAMEQIIEALHAAAKALDEAANRLAGQNVPHPSIAPATNEAEKTLTLEEVRKVAADKARQLSGVDAARYPAMMKELEAMGHAD